MKFVALCEQTTKGKVLGKALKLIKSVKIYMVVLCISILFFYICKCVRREKGRETIRNAFWN